MTSSPHFPQSNRMAEKGIQIAKYLTKKAVQDGRDPYLTLLEYQNTLMSHALGSSAQRLMGRRTKLIIPIPEELLKPRIIDLKTVQQELTYNKLSRNPKWES